MSFHGRDLYPWFLRRKSLRGNFFCGSFFCGIRDRREIARLDAFSFLIIDSRGGWQLARSKVSSSASTCPQGPATKIPGWARRHRSITERIARELV
jgi:hypothetical protein